MGRSKRPRRGIIPGSRGGPLSDVSLGGDPTRISATEIGFHCLLMRLQDDGTYDQTGVPLADGTYEDFPATFFDGTNSWLCTGAEIASSYVTLTFAGAPPDGGVLYVESWEPALTSADGIWCAGAWLKIDEY